MGLPQPILKTDDFIVCLANQEKLLVLAEWIKTAILRVEGIEEVEVDLNWEPFWKLEYMTDIPQATHFMNKDEYVSIFKKHGLTDIAYLDAHFQRFVFTQKVFYENWPHGQSGRLLDIGAHWLHQAILYATKGFSVTAADFPITFKETSVQSLAEEYNIALYPYDDLSTANSLPGLPDDSFDVIIFSEIIEHITFNPVLMWRELYRLLAPGGRIVVTTPNYYYIKGHAWSPKRFLSGRGGGITVEEILNQNTYGHHWKEYTGKEIVEYFHRLSKDFNVSRLVHIRGRSVGDTETQKFVELIENFTPWLRKNLHVEVDLPVKAHGIEITPSW